MKNKTKTAKKLLALVLSLMMVITALPMMAVTSSAAAIDDLASAISAYESKVSAGKFYDNLAAAFEAYNNAKRYYDAVTYGGVDGSSAQTYADALNYAVNNMNETTQFKDFSNSVKVKESPGGSYINNGNTISNLLYYPTDLGFATANSLWGGGCEVYNGGGRVVFKVALPNFVLGIDGNNDAKVPVQLYFFRAAKTPTVEIVRCDNSDTFSFGNWNVGSNTASTSDSTAYNALGTWYGDTTTDYHIQGYNNGGTNTYSFTYGGGTYVINQASTYLTTNSTYSKPGALNVNSPWTYSNVGITFHINAGDSGTQYAPNYGTGGGRGYIVYMTLYNANYENWKNIIPNLSYKNYNGYAYNTNATVAAERLDAAAAYSLEQTGFSSTGDISSSVSDWATRINAAATKLNEAKTSANGTTKISSNYSSLINAITAAKPVIEAGQKCYTDTTWNNFVAAYENAKAHMAALSPAGTNNQYSTDDMTILTLAENLSILQSRLAYKTDPSDACHVYPDTPNSTEAATCVKDGYNKYICTVCGAEKTETLSKKGHDFTEQVIDEAHLKSAATCKAYAVYYYDCSRCDVMATDTDTNPTFEYTAGGYGAHKFDAQSTDAQYLASDASCTAKAKYYYSCSVCGEKGTETFESGYLAAHTPGEWIVDTAATCTTNGSKHQVCSVCKATIATETITASGHTEISANNGVAATCTTAGKESDTVCSVCHETLTTGATIPALGHSFTGNAVANGDGKHSYKCVRCDAIGTGIGETAVENGTEACSGGTATCTDYATCEKCSQEYGSLAAHKFTTYTSNGDATCTADGTETAFCDYGCGAKDTRTKAGSALEHDFTNSTTYVHVEGTETHAKKCTRCDVLDTANAVACSGGSATCQAKAKCAVCGSEYGSLADHKYTTYTSNGDATCTADGTESAFCDYGCDTKYTRTAEGSALGHDFTNSTTYVHVEGTKTHVKKCARCDVLDTANAEACSGGTANCQDKAVCTNCGTAYGEVDSNNHKTVVIDEAVAPTCTETGLTEGKHCSACDSVIVAQDVVDAKGHSYKDTVTDPTCTTDGYTTHTCSVCGYSCTDTVVPAAGHTKEEIAAVDATCTEKGHTAGEKCSVCGEILTATTETPALGHDYSEKIQDYAHRKNDADCVNAETYYFDCSRCDKNARTDEDAQDAVYTVGDPLGHDPVQKLEDRYLELAASCTNAAVYHYACSRCDAILEDTFTYGTFSGHSFTNYVDDNNATCFQNGTKTAHCDNEGCTAIDVKVIFGTKLTHEFTNYTSNNDATCKEDGTKSAPCNHGCGTISTIKDEGSKLSTHTPGDIIEVVVPATCTEKGVGRTFCSVCGLEFNPEIAIDEDAHLWDEGTVTDRPVYDEANDAWSEGTITYTCQRDASHTKTDKVVRAQYTEYDAIVSELEAIVKSGRLVEKGNKIITDALDKYAVADNLVTAEQPLVDAAANALKAIKEEIKIAEINGSIVKPDFTDFDAVVEEFNEYESSETAKQKVADIKEAVDMIRNDPNSTKKDDQKKVDDYAAEVRAIIDSLSLCQKGEHEYSSIYTVDKESTCTEKGSKSKHCIYCDAKGEAVEIALKAHEYGEWTVKTPASCGIEGEEARSCVVCGDEQTRTLAAVTHEWSDWEVIIEPTCQKVGQEKSVCIHCGNEKTRAIPKAEHTIVVIPEVKATCETDGSTEGRYCSECGTVFKEVQTVKATGHGDYDGDGHCDACGKENEGDCNCICHKSFWLMKIIYKILQFFWKLFGIGHTCSCGATHY